MAKIAFFALELGILKKYEQVRSAHIQVPLRLYKELNKNKDRNEPIFITNKMLDGHALPNELESEKVKFIHDPLVRSKQPVMEVGFVAKPRLKSLAKAFYDLVKLIKFHQITVLYVSGSLKTILFCGCLAILHPRLKIVWGTFHSFPRLGWVGELFLKTVLHRIIVFSDCQKNSFPERLAAKTIVLRHGAIRNLKIPPSKKKNRVTFWRDASFLNGFDIARDAFEILARKYPEITFTFMVRQHWDKLQPPEKIKNLEFFEYPYPAGHSLEKVLSETCLCIFPFRRLSTNPQLSILETLEADIPCLISGVESNVEIISPICFLLEELSIDAIVDAVSDFLSQPTENPQRNSINFNWHTVSKSLNDIFTV